MAKAVQPVSVNPATVKLCACSAIGAMLAIQLTQTGIRLTQKSISSISQEPKVPILIKMTVSIGISRQMLI